MSEASMSGTSSPNADKSMPGVLPCCAAAAVTTDQWRCCLLKDFAAAAVGVTQIGTAAAAAAGVTGG